MLGNRAMLGDITVIVQHMKYVGGQKEHILRYVINEDFSVSQTASNNC